VRNIKTSAGSLTNLAICNTNITDVAYVALYDELAINVTAGTTTPKCVLTIAKATSLAIPFHNVAFSTAISFFSATAYNGGTALTNVFVTALYDG
jgi:hypothetical protein